MTLTQQDLISLAQNGQLLARDMCGSDLTSVLSIESRSQASPWGRLSFEESLTKEHFCRVLEVDDQDRESVDSKALIVGYHIVCPIVDELHILNVVASPEYRGVGLGHRLMQDVFEIAMQHSCKRIFLEVRASNEIAQSLYLKWKFKQIGLRKQYYRPSSVEALREDALVFMCDEF